MDEDMAAFLFMQTVIEEGDDDASDEELEAHLATALIITGANVARILRNECRNPTQNYLCRPQLQPNPQTDTAWQVLFNSRNDCAYITTMGFNVETFELIVQSGFGEHWYMQAIPHTDSRSRGEPRPGARSLDAWGALGLVLHYLNSTMREITLQQVFALIPTTTSWYITFGLRILLKTLREMPDAAIRWPHEDEEFQNDSELIVACHPRLEGAFASIDGLNLPTQTSQDPDIENATYNRWLSEHYISSVIVFSLQGSFGRLCMPLQINNKEGRADLLEICFRLHNLHT